MAIARDLIGLGIGVLVSSALGWSATMPAGAQLSPPPEETLPLRIDIESTASDTQERADRLLRAAMEFVSNQQTLRFEAEITYDNVFSTGEKAQYTAYQETTLQRPNLLRTDYSGNLRATRFFYDGRSATLQDTDRQFYATSPAPPTVDETIVALRERFNVRLPLSNLLSSDPYALIAPQIESSRYLGLSVVNGLPCHSLLFVGKDVNFQIWIVADGDPVPQKLVINYKNLPGSPQYSALFVNWDFSPAIAPDTFAFVAPEGVGRVRFIPSTDDLP
ncbi:putative periplasmic protein [Rubidibacter lacunae KORDI 51-2]|uniref:Putative periplasmic protein n=1 Tax=Rubidibacter lacunae KORDI 51-2 TaxID=582515 RepID=U5DPG6_9CHRO|nr:DUF2092 domain-containing protein [Rubidibacter lacunae]ERN42747.1 putative periplasmic protein [Rubidibacter lacunae KORDI 51-2]